MNTRLKLIYSLIENGKGVIDVGTDHGYIPAALAKSAYTGNIFASDINAGPLDSARRTAAENGVADRIEFLLSDGLQACPQDAVDTIVIAGMGGDLICHILDYAPWTMSDKYTLILQPMTKAEVLRYWLVYNGFEILEELLVLDTNLYQVLKVRFGGAQHLSDAELFTGSFEMIKDSPLFPDELQALKKRFASILKGLAAADMQSSGRYSLYSGILSELEKMENEL